MKKKLLLFFSILFISSSIAQQNSDLIYVDESGRIRWTENNEKAYFFGVNYATPFAFSYRALKNKGINHKEIIDLDIQQFKRLGLNAYRIHVWDREVSDREGNLLENEHIELLDYLIAKLIENDIYIILTPIAWWGTGWPEPDLNTPGFSTFYSKIESTTRPEVIEAHKNYLEQFVNHKNSYTGKAYKDEEKIIAFEIFNEPNLPKNSDSITYYVNTMVKVLRDEDITKPVFFNISENPEKEQWEGVASSNINGVSFQWYPTGLVKLSELKGNFLPNVMSYPLPDYTDKLKNKAKMVYEFDAADIGKSYMYPVMAHSFKETGMQFAAIFCYDPTPLAQFNSEYQTHFLNLLYTPQKALGYLISSNLFNNEEVDQKKLDSTSFIMNNVIVDYESDLSILNSHEKFYYTNNNNIIPKDINQLKHIAGYGNSPVIKYEGRGSYFLDKVNDGLWKLEVYPDAVWLKDPFGRNGLDEPVAALIWKPHKMQINLPNFKKDYKIFSKDGEQTAIDASINVEPGFYYLTNDENLTVKNLGTGTVDFDLIERYGHFIHDFESKEIKNLTPSTFYENDTKRITVEVYSKEDADEVNLYIKKIEWRSYQKFKMQKINDFVYEIELPQQISSNGLLEYFVTVNSENSFMTFPGKLNETPNSWSFNSDVPYRLKIFPPSNKRIIYSPIKDIDNLISANLWRYAEYGIDYTFDENQNPELSVEIRNVRQKFDELALQIYVGENVSEDESYNEIEFEMKAENNAPDSVLIRVLYANTEGFEEWINPSNEYQTIKIKLREPENFRYALLPRPYPTFLPYWYESDPKQNKNTYLKPESIQIAIPFPKKGRELNGYGFKLKSISVTKND